VTNPGYLTPPTTATYYFGGRGNFKTDTVSATDLSINYLFPVPALSTKSEFFLRFVIENLFNQRRSTARTRRCGPAVTLAKVWRRSTRSRPSRCSRELRVRP